MSMTKDELRDFQALVHTVAYMLDVMKWQLRGEPETAQRALEAAHVHFARLHTRTATMTDVSRETSRRV